LTNSVSIIYFVSRILVSLHNSYNITVVKRQFQNIFQGQRLLSSSLLTYSYVGLAYVVLTIIFNTTFLLPYISFGNIVSFVLRKLSSLQLIPPALLWLLTILLLPVK